MYERLVQLSRFQSIAVGTLGSKLSYPKHWLKIIVLFLGHSVLGQHCSLVDRGHVLVGLRLQLSPGHIIRLILVKTFLETRYSSCSRVFPQSLLEGICRIAITIRTRQYIMANRIYVPYCFGVSAPLLILFVYLIILHVTVQR